MSSADYMISIALCGITLFLDVLLLIDSFSTFTSDVIQIKKIRRLFLAGSIQALVYFVEYIISEYRYFEIRSVGMIIETVLYIANLFYLVSYADLIFSKYRYKLKDRKIGRFLFLSPALVLLVLEITNIFYPMFFNILPDTLEYVETPYSFILTIIPTLYVVITAVRDVEEWKDNTHYYNLPLSLYFLFVIIGMVAESIVYDYPIIPVSCYVSMIIMYNRTLKRIGYIDDLSGLFTRSHLKMYIDSLLSSKRKTIIAGIMLDVNRFKSINDTYGHMVGDRAIQAVGKILKQAARKTDRCFRYGGDEFVVILNVKDVSEIEDCMNRINRAAEEFNQTKTEVFELSLSQGYAIYDKDHDSVIEFAEKMDAEMYQNKCMTK